MVDLTDVGLADAAAVYHNLSTPALFEEIVRRREGRASQGGALVVRTGEYTGRSPGDKFIVEEPSSREHIWWGNSNRPLDQANFARLKARVLDHLRGKDIFVQDVYTAADPRYRLPVRVISERAWHSLFARALFRPDWAPGEAEAFRPSFTVIAVPGFHAVPEIDGTRSEAVIAIHFGERLVIIGATSYAGEIKKAMFTVMNYLLPRQGVLSMHCSANRGAQGDTAIFFGLSGTGKTTLSSEPERALIGDDEHARSATGTSNIEGGCYAKVIRLSPRAERESFQTTRNFGTVLENVIMDEDTP